MATIGVQLREARERKGWSVSDAAKATRIKSTQIEAMERDEFGRISSPIYEKGFIKLYCEAVGLSAAPLLQEYAAHHAPHERPTLLRQEPPRFRPPAPRAAPAPSAPAEPAPAAPSAEVAEPRTAAAPVPVPAEPPAAPPPPAPVLAAAAAPGAAEAPAAEPPPIVERGERPALSMPGESRPPFDWGPVLAVLGRAAVAVLALAVLVGVGYGLRRLGSRPARAAPAAVAAAPRPAADPAALIELPPTPHLDPAEAPLLPAARSP